MQQLEVTVGIGGAAGDGSGATGDNLAKVCSRLGLHVFAYNSYQSLVRGGHVWLRLRIGAQKVMTHGDHLNLLIGLNQDTLDRHAREVVPGGGILYNERLKVVQDDLQPGVQLYALPIRDLLQPFGRQTILQRLSVQRRLRARWAMRARRSSSPESHLARTLSENAQ